MLSKYRYFHIVIVILLLFVCVIHILTQQEIAFLSLFFGYAMLVNFFYMQCCSSLTSLLVQRINRGGFLWIEKLHSRKENQLLITFLFFNIKLKNQINLYNARKPKTHHIMCVRFTKILLKLRVATKLVPLAGTIRKRNLLLHCWIISSIRGGKAPRPLSLQLLK